MECLHRCPAAVPHGRRRNLSASGAAKVSPRTPATRSLARSQLCVGYTAGVFDLFHIGHLNLLRRAGAQCDQLVVGVTTDELALAMKGKRPFIPFEERCEIVGSIRYVHKVVPQESDDKVHACQHLGAARLFVGDDWRGAKKWRVIEESLRQLGIALIWLPYTLHTSSTQLQKALLALTQDSRAQASDPR